MVKKIAVLVIAAFLIESYRSILRFFEWIWNGIVIGWNFLFSAHSVSLPILAWLVIAIIVLIVIIILGRLYRIPKNKNKALSYIDYREENILGAKWRWRWDGEHILNLWCFCPICDGQLVCQERLFGPAGKISFLCEHCGMREIFAQDGEYPSDVVASAEREIYRRIRTKEAFQTLRESKS